MPDVVDVENWCQEFGAAAFHKLPKTMQKFFLESKSSFLFKDSKANLHPRGEQQVCHWKGESKDQSHKQINTGPEQVTHFTNTYVSLWIPDLNCDGGAINATNVELYVFCVCILVLNTEILHWWLWDET